MMLNTDLNQNLIKVSDEEWLTFIELLTENIYDLNQRKLKSVEVMLIPDEYPEIIFRLTTVRNYAEGTDVDCEVAGFAVGIALNDYDDIYIEPLTEQGIMWNGWRTTT